MSYCKKTIILKSKENYQNGQKILTLESVWDKTNVNLKQNGNILSGEAACYIMVNSKPVGSHKVVISSNGEMSFGINTSILPNDNVLVITTFGKDKALFYGTSGVSDLKVISNTITKIASGEKFETINSEKQTASSSSSATARSSSVNKPIATANQIVSTNKTYINKKADTFEDKIDEKNSQGQSGKACDYYELIKDQLGEMFITYPQVNVVSSLFKESKFIKVDCQSDGSYYLLGKIFENGKVTKIVYAIETKNAVDVPVDLKDSCQFVRLENFTYDNLNNDEVVGFFVMTQNMQNGEVDSL